LSETCFNEFSRLIHKLTGITLSSNRTSMLEGRLRKRLTVLGLHSWEEYLEFVQRDKTEEVQFVDLVTTNETYFFRTPRVWDYIEKKFLPDWHAKHPGKPFFAWSAAASSGEEAHSLGILCQAFKEKNSSFQYQVTGTDISQEMISLCEKGHYSNKSIDSFRKTKPDLFAKYMKTIDGHIFQASSEIRSRLRFQTHNLFKSYSGKDRFDLVLIRNVLIYFKGPDQEKVLSLIALTLEKDGRLIIGESESLSHITTPFKHTEPLIYQLDSPPQNLKQAG